MPTSFTIGNNAAYFKGVVILAIRILAFRAFFVMLFSPGLEYASARTQAGIGESD